MDFQFRTECDVHKGDPGPVAIACLQPTNNAVLCEDMAEAMKDMESGKTIDFT